jgi:hypothetical protein
MSLFPSIIVERRDSRGGRFSVRVPYIVKGDWIVIDHLSALGAFVLLQSEANTVHGEPVIKLSKRGRNEPRKRRKEKS